MAAINVRQTASIKKISSTKLVLMLKFDKELEPIYSYN